LDCQHAAIIIDLRPSRLDIDALLRGTSLDAIVRRAVVAALDSRSLLFGSEASSESSLDANGRLSNSDIDIALAEFDEQTRRTVKSVLSQVGGVF
jgi:hypothetical protein